MSLLLLNPPAKRRRRKKRRAKRRKGNPLFTKTGQRKVSRLMDRGYSRSAATSMVYSKNPFTASGQSTVGKLMKKGISILWAERRI